MLYKLYLLILSKSPRKIIKIAFSTREGFLVYNYKFCCFCYWLALSYGFFGECFHFKQQPLAPVINKHQFLKVLSCRLLSEGSTCCLQLQRYTSKSHLFIIIPKFPKGIIFRLLLELSSSLS